MSIFGPRKVSRLSAWLEARRAVHADRPLPPFLEDRAAIARGTSPRNGEPPYVLAIEPDGRVIHTANTKYIEQDPLAAPADADLRRQRGAMAADYLLHQGYLANEKLSRSKSQCRALETEREALRGRIGDYVNAQGTPARLFFQVAAAPLGLVLLAAGELGALTLVVADWFGVDLARAGALAHDPVGAGAVLLAAVGIFVATVMLAEKAIGADDALYRAVATVALIGVGLGLGIMRAAQIEGSRWQQAFVFLLVTVAIPCAVAVLRRRAALWAAILGEGQKLRWRERDIRRHLTRAETDVRAAEQELDAIVAEFSDEYMRARAVEKAEREAWRAWLHALEASLAEYRLSYLWWAARGRINPVGSGALAKVASAVVLLPLVLSAGSCAPRPSAVHMEVLCDRSSSGAEFACPASTIVNAGTWWADQAALSGGTFEVWLVGEDIETTLFTAERYPERFKPPVAESKRAWRQVFERRLQAAVTTLPVDQGSAIAEGMWRVSRRLREAGPGRNVLLVASDLRQITPGAWDFERRVPAPDAFLGWLRSAGLTPELPSSTDVLVCGVHSESPARTAHATAETYRRTRSLWAQVFAAWHVNATITEQCPYGRELARR
jgi:hypothetical protein